MYKRFVLTTFKLDGTQTVHEDYDTLSRNLHFGVLEMKEARKHDKI